jgi:hypothetical protein
MSANAAVIRDSAISVTIAGGSVTSRKWRCSRRLFRVITRRRKVKEMKPTRRHDYYCQAIKKETSSNSKMINSFRLLKEKVALNFPNVKVITVVSGY